MFWYFEVDWRVKTPRSCSLGNYKSQTLKTSLSKYLQTFSIWIFSFSYYQALKKYTYLYITQITHSSATSNTSPLTSSPKWNIKLLKTTKNGGNKSNKDFSFFFFGVILKLCESYKVVILLVYTFYLKEWWEVAWIVTGSMQRCYTDTNQISKLGQY